MEMGKNVGECHIREVYGNIFFKNLIQISIRDSKIDFLFSIIQIFQMFWKKIF